MQLLKLWGLIFWSTVFSKCADYMDQGRRLENLSWRLWTRETFCVEPETSSEASVLPLLRSEAGDLPDLSSSVESAASDQAEKIEHHIKRPKCDYKPAVVREDSMVNLGRGKEKHITSSGLERMVMNIKERKNLEPISTAMASVSPPVDITTQPSSPTPTPPSNSTAKAVPTRPTRPPLEPRKQTESTESCSTTAPEGNDSDIGTQDGSDTSVSSSSGIPSRPGLYKSPSIVRGFSPSHISSSYRSQSRLAPEPNKMSVPVQHKPSPLKKKGGMFTLGGSSGDDDESSFDDRMIAQRTQRSSLSDELSKPSTIANTPNKKVTTFKDQVGTIEPSFKEGSRDSDEDAIETDDDISESAIDDDEDSDWEDSVTESGRSSVNTEGNQMFRRVDSRNNLVSRRSMLTMMMNQPNRMQNAAFRSSPALQRSRLTSPNGPSGLPTSPPHDGFDVPRSNPIVVQPTPQSMAHSPRTTRRNMLATELTESLRHHLLWERQQKSSTANAFLKRRHTAHDGLANLQEYPGLKSSQRAQTGPVSAKQHREKDQSKTNGSWTNYTDYGPWEYHAKGW